MMEAYSVVFSGSVEEELGGSCWPAGAEEDVEEGAILCTHRRRDGSVDTDFGLRVWEGLVLLVRVFAATFELLKNARRERAGDERR